MKEEKNYDSYKKITSFYYFKSTFTFIQFVFCILHTEMAPKHINTSLASNEKNKFTENQGDGTPVSVFHLKCFVPTRFISADDALSDE